MQRRSRRMLGQGGVAAILFALSAVPLAISVGIGIDMSRIASARASLQRAVDNAALSGAAAYVLYTENDSFSSIAQNIAASSFCAAAATLEPGLTLVALSGGRTCAGTAGPAISTAIAGYNNGTRGVAQGSGCAANNSVVQGATCGFTVTVATSAIYAPIFPILLGVSRRIAVTATAVNPFIDLGTAMNAKMVASAWNANSIWVYPLLLDSDGNPDYATNPGALPDRSSCSGNPAQTSCGEYTMLASSFYCQPASQTGKSTSTPCTASYTDPASGTTTVTNFNQGGTVQDPHVTSAVITATTPIGFAFESVAGASTHYPVNTAAPAGGTSCVFPPSAVYNTVAQAYDSTGHAQLPWNIPAHWFFSSYLENNLPPSWSEIAQQMLADADPTTGYPASYQDIQAVAPPSRTWIPTGCDNPPDTPNNPDREYFPTTYPMTGANNCSLEIYENVPAGAAAPVSGSCFTPPGTPLYRAAALSCTNYHGNSFTFFWNDMGGIGGDDKDYNDGVVTVTCNGPSTVRLID